MNSFATRSDVRTFLRQELINYKHFHHHGGRRRSSLEEEGRIVKSDGVIKPEYPKADKNDPRLRCRFVTKPLTLRYADGTRIAVGDRYD